MSTITSIRLGPKYAEKVGMLNSLARQYPLAERLARVPPDFLTGLADVSLGELDAKVRLGRALSVKEAFQGMMLVIAATNNVVRKTLFSDMLFEVAVAKGAYFLTFMAAKELYVGLTPEEIAGIAAAGQVDVLFTPTVASVVETAGMGADRGWGTKDVKTINASTLSALVMAAMGYTTFKHGSYGNTTRVGSTDVLEQFGARSAFVGGPRKIAQILRRTGFWFSDAHAVKTLHYMSHLLRVETVNHIVGPMTAPISPDTQLHKVIGVNHYVHPEDMARAYVLLNSLGLVSLGSVVVVAGVDAIPMARELRDWDWFKNHAYLDEISPSATIISVATAGFPVETRVLSGRRDFGVELVDSQIKVPNTIPTLMRANAQALTGGPLAEYLATNVALALLAVYPENLDNLHEHVGDALETIESGKALETLEKYVRETGGSFVQW